MKKITGQYLLEIIQKEMGLPKEAVWLRDQNALIPNDNCLYIEAGLVNSQIMVSQSYLITTQEDWDELPDNWDGNDVSWDEGQTVEVSRVQACESIQIDIFSRSNQAVTRHWEVVAAMQSLTAKQAMETNSFKIFRVPRNFLNTSSAEGGSQLNRYTITIDCFVWYMKLKVLPNNGGDYYDDFHQRVDDEKSIGTETPIIAFEINQEGIVP